MSDPQPDHQPPESIWVSTTLAKPIAGDVIESGHWCGGVVGARKLNPPGISMASFDVGISVSRIHGRM